MTTKYAEIDAESLGRSLTGFGINLLVSDVPRCAEFLSAVLEFEVLRQSQDFAILRHRDTIYQLHGDHTYSENPLPSLVPESGPRGGGVELRIYHVDPDAAEARARAAGAMVLQASADKPHGLRECFLLDPDGYCWVPSVPKQARDS
jgi:catechol 2,3-dioxygenase-like lactoylglutathione lyase family enzyme